MAQTPEMPDMPDDADPNRRTVLRGVAFVGVAGAAGLPLGKPKPKDKALRPDGKAVAATGDIPVGGGKYFEDAQLIVTQPTAGTFKGFDSACTHTGCPVTDFATPGKMVCTCHHASFAIDDGHVLRGPAKKPMKPKDIVVQNGQVFKAAH